MRANQAPLLPPAWKTLQAHEELTLAFYVTSQGPTPGCARRFGELARGHWGGCENRNHWVRDVCMREDKTRQSEHRAEKIVESNLFR